MKAFLTLTAVLAAVAIVAPISLAAGAQAQGYTFITDTRGGHGHAPRAHAQGYRFITDTLGGSGSAHTTTVIRDAGFSWADAGVGAVAVAGSMLILVGGALVVLRRRGGLAI
jgi:hypothetical protein